MSKLLTRDDYYKIILEILSLNRITIDRYLESKCQKHSKDNPHYAEILYIDINYIFKDFIVEEPPIENGNFIIKEKGFKLAGDINNLQSALDVLRMKLYYILLDLEIKNINDKLEKVAKDFTYIYSTPIYQKKLDRLAELLKSTIKKAQEKIKRKKRVAIPLKLRAALQKEIQSECPFCSNDDVGHFEAHHINGNSSQSMMSNLLLLCPLCHSKIEKKDISYNEVIEVKTRLIAGIKRKIELASINIDSQNCSWEAHEDIDNVFTDEVSPKSPFPILDFNFINHSDKTITLKSIRIKKKSLPSGLSGLLTEPYMVKLITKYKIQIKGENTTYRVLDTFQVPAKQAFRFQAELFEGNAKNPISIEGRNILYFSFEFSDKIIVNSPSVYFNCIEDVKDEYRISAIGFGS